MNARAPLSVLGSIAWLFLLAGCATLSSAPQSELRLQTGRYGHAVVAADHKLYVVGGSGPEGLLGDIETLDPRSGKTEILATNLIPRRYHSAVLVGRRIYVVGGESDMGPEPTVEIFDLDTQTVSLGMPLPTPRRLSKAVLLDGSIYVVGGQDPLNRCEETGTGIVEACDVANNEWRKVADLPTPRECAVVVAQGKLWAIGGFDGDEAALAVVETYDPRTDRWTRAPDMPFHVSAHSAICVPGAIFTFGDYRMLDRVARLDLRQGTWTELDVAYVKSRHNACAALGGDIFVVGGNVASTGSYLDVVQRFAVRDLRAARPRSRTGTELRGFLEPSQFAGMLVPNAKTLGARDRAEATLQTATLQLASQEIVRFAQAEFRLHLDRQPLLVRLSAEVWHQGALKAPEIVVNGKSAGAMQFNWPSLRERNYVAFLWNGDSGTQYAFDYQGWLRGTAFIDRKWLKPGDNSIAIKVGTDQIKVRTVKAEVLSAFDDRDTLYDMRGNSRAEPIPMAPADP